MFDRLRALFFCITTPLQIFMQRVGRQEPLMMADKVDRCLDLVKPGDILLSYESGRPTSYLIKGYYDHAAIVTHKKTVMEAVGNKYIFLEDYSWLEIMTDYFRIKLGQNSKLKRRNLGGVREVDLSEWLYKKDSVCIIRPVYKSSKFNFNLLASKAVMFYKGLGYDYSFTFGNLLVYCSELIYASYLKNDLNFMTHIRYDKEILPMDYYAACSDSHRDDMFFQIIFEARN
jgi:hypothetical protein